jgi:DNA polymerase I-like protein with 3'-5' exonuclease and polymerase domains|tara:strand:- start:2038 stop:2754 length:717 start_codon:yes stop_codon:yes gene_type:complete
MLLQADAKQLEWIGATYLSQDKVAIDEILREVDMHSENQKRFKLPSRLIAKTFVFRLIYGGSAYSYAHDPDFRDIGNESFWQDVIDAFYNKYQRLYKWHEEIQFKAKREQKLIMPTGRIYHFEPEVKFDRVKYPRTKILNYPVQGLGADLMAIARVSLRNRLKGKKGIQLVNTVHDSIIVDFDPKVCYTNDLVNIVDKCFNDVPDNFKKLFGVDFNLPMRVECEVGNSWGNMETIHAN